MHKLKKYCAILLFSFSVCLALPGTVWSDGFKVLVVMSYDEKYAWEQEIREGIEEVLAGKCVTEYFYLDTKRHLAGGKEKAKEALRFFKEFKPDGVIAADDNAQSLFVAPYLKEKADIPVIFCGVNMGAEVYGYPAKNITGILERIHIRNSVAFAQQLIPSVKLFACISRETPSSRAILVQYEAEKDTYPATPIAFKMPKTLEEALSMAKELKGVTDILFFETMEGMPDAGGKLYTDREVIPMLAEVYGKPIISNNLYHVEYGSLCAVIKTGQEQGRIASEMVMQAMQGRPVAEIPITQNRLGKRVINLTVMKSFGIKPGSDALRDAQLVGIHE